MLKLGAIILSKLSFYFLSLPLRIWRLILHLFFLFKIIFKPDNLPIHYTFYRKSIIWSIELMHYLIDLAGIPEILEITLQVIHPGNRQLTIIEKSKISSIYGNEVLLYPLSLDLSHSFMRQSASAFVGVNTIFFNTELNDETLIHEVCHCLQYQRYGSVYIIRALLAQRSKEGYEYGGLHFLKKWVVDGQINQLNYEQMAEILTHAFIFKSETGENHYSEREKIMAVYDVARQKILDQINDQDSVSRVLRLWR